MTFRLLEHRQTYGQIDRQTDIRSSCKAIKISALQQWRTQEFCSGEGGFNK
jgi:hypothetical protein